MVNFYVMYTAVHNYQDLSIHRKRTMGEEGVKIGIIALINVGHMRNVTTVTTSIWKIINISKY